jgi:hypothetical protein
VAPLLLDAHDLVLGEGLEVGRVLRVGFAARRTQAIAVYLEAVPTKPANLNESGWIIGCLFMAVG